MTYILVRHDSHITGFCLFQSILKSGEENFFSVFQIYPSTRTGTIYNVAFAPFMEEIA